MHNIALLKCEKVDSVQKLFYIKVDLFNLNNRLIQADVI